MVSFEYWFENILATCELIASRDTFKTVWVLGDKTITSIHYPSELFEQLLGDLRLEEGVEFYKDKLRELDQFEAVAAFASALLNLERNYQNNPDAEKLLASQEWATCQLTAGRVIYFQRTDRIR